MKKLLFLLIVSGAISAFGQNAFDGTWRMNMETAKVQGSDKYLLQGGTWQCDTCVPKISVKADGQDHKVSGSPYYDTTSVREVSDQSVEMIRKKDGKVMATIKMTVSDDGKTLTTDWTNVFENGQEGNGKFTSKRVSDAPAGANKVSGTWQPGKMEGASESVRTITLKATSDGLSMSDPMGDSYTAKFDGKDYPYKGDPGTTSVSLKKIDANTIEETDKRDGKVISVTRMTVGSDGKTMQMKFDDKLHNTSGDLTWDKQ